MAVRNFPRLRSTYICARASFYPYTIPAIQALGSLLDVFLIVTIDRIVTRGSENTGVPPVIRLADPGWASLVSTHTLARPTILADHKLRIGV